MPAVLSSGRASMWLGRWVVSGGRARRDRDTVGRPSYTCSCTHSHYQSCVPKMWPITMLYWYEDCIWTKCLTSGSLWWLDAHYQSSSWWVWGLSQRLGVISYRSHLNSGVVQDFLYLANPLQSKLICKCYGIPCNITGTSTRLIKRNTCPHSWNVLPKISHQIGSYTNWGQRQRCFWDLNMSEA